MEENTIEILKKLEGEKPFVVMADKYGKAIAESIIAKSNVQNIKRLNFEDEFAKRVEIKGNSYALIYKGPLPLRLSPFLWSLDQETRRSWAVFSFNNFYGHANQPWWKPWKNIKKPIVLTPFSADPKLVDSFGKGYLAKFDEGTQFQEPIGVIYDKATMESTLEDRNFISAALTLWQDLQAYTKAKLNMNLIYIVILIAAVLIAGYFMWPSISAALGNFFPKAT